jgi:ankyrin repeat protein
LSLDLNNKDNSGKTALIWATIQNNYNIVDILLKNRASVEVSDNIGKTPLIWAAELGFLDIVKILLNYKPIIDRRDQDSMSALSWASLNGNTDIMKILIENNANIDLSDRNGSTPLMHASWSGNLDAVKLLVQCGADINRCDYSRQTVLFRAGYKNFTNILEYLLMSGADFKIQDVSLWTVFMWTLIQDNYESSDLLLKYGFNVNEIINDELPILIFFTKERNHKAIKYLLKIKNIKIDIFDKRQKTALMYASEVGDIEMVQLLLENGASPFKSDRHGNTPFLYAIENNHIKVSELIHKKVLQFRKSKL